jgi:hypothetical protein
VLTDVSRVTTDPDAAAAAKRRLAVLDEQEARMRALAAEASAQAAAIVAARRASDERAAAAEADAARAAVADAAAVGEPADAPRLRAVRRGEERAYGDLVDLQCGASEVRVHLRVGSRLIVATAGRIENLTLTSFLPDKDFAIKCGRRDTPDAVYLTWRSAPHRAEGAATVVGQAVAIEFVPRGYTP